MRPYEEFRPGDAAQYELKVILNLSARCMDLVWTPKGTPDAFASCRIFCTGLNELTWQLAYSPTERYSQPSSHHRNAIRARLDRYRQMFPTAEEDVRLEKIEPDPHSRRPRRVPLALFRERPEDTVWDCLETHIVEMAEALRGQFSPMGKLPDADMLPVFDDFIRHEQKREDKARRQAEELEERMEMMRRQRRAQEFKREHARRKREAEEAARQAQALEQARQSARLPVPPVPVQFEVPPLAAPTAPALLPDLRRYFLLENASRWWVSNQTDDLLALTFCHIARLDYQIRTALRVIGPLRGRALLSDEVGLGKTIEAGLVLKEYLTRGMIKRCLVLTVPSLVDQWEEELQEKFDVTFATTNQPAFRSDPVAFWQQNPFIIASLHTLKQPAHLAVAQPINWDLLVVDEAHYLRNRTSQAWQAVNALPRQYLLLLTATPVQNSLEDLYNLVTLLHPGQLPSPKEFRERFMDNKNPNQPREPEELRRLLGQVMIRNTRANSGLHLPARHAETVLFEAAPEELAFWQEWEGQFRKSLDTLSSNQASLWGRLLLQAAGSSPAAWLEAVEKFPLRQPAREWRQKAPLESSWAKKCELVLPLTRVAGGVVIFTQFLHTQSALAERLRAAKVPVHVISGQTPAVQRQPITEEFRRVGGALLLTHSGTEGRNLQFSHQLINFDLPWNPMEIEQRIGRLHRLGQAHPVHIYNLVQKHTLQEHLLNLLQEKLNLFELVVGETGLILGERFSTDEFAEEVLRRWRESEGQVAESLHALGEDLASAKAEYDQIKQLDETLFAKDYETL